VRRRDIRGNQGRGEEEDIRGNQGRGEEEGYER
jgi:hypothetical protein